MWEDKNNRENVKRGMKSLTAIKVAEIRENTN